MMNNIQKLYKIAGVDKKPVYSGSQLYNPVITGYEYPLFTTEKQLELIKWLCINTYRNYIHFRFEQDINSWKMECNMWGILECGSFEECLAKLVVEVWQELTDDQKQEIKEILQ